MAVIRFNRAPSRWPAVGRLPLAVLLVWAVLVGVFMLLKPAGSDATLCMFRNVTGLPCPTCGSSRAALAVARGRPLDALVFNPLMTAAAALAITWLGVRVVLARRLELDLSPAMWSVIAVLLGANWVYVILEHT